MQYFMAGLELIMRSEVFLVLIKLIARSYRRVKFSMGYIYFFFSESPKTNTLN